MCPEPIDPPGEGYYIVIAKDQSQYNPLPAKVSDDGTIHTCWSFTNEERYDIEHGANLHLFISTFGKPLQPLRMEVNSDY